MPIAFSLCATSLPAETPFDRQDTNGDGTLSRREFRGPSAAFKRIDRNHDGYITHQEAKGTPLRVHGDPAGPAKRRSRFAATTELVVVDTHNHLVGPKVTGDFRLEKSAPNALEIMDATGVRINLLMPPPQTVSPHFHS